jgi:hypothetical protein
MADNRFNKSLEEHFINNDTQYNFGGWTPRRALDTETLFVVGGYYLTDRLGYSYDGLIWSASTNGDVLFQSAVYSVEYGNNMWVVGSQKTPPLPGLLANSLGYSYDGITWSASTNGNSLIGATLDIAWNGSMWVAVGIGTPSDVVYSYDGKTWSAATNSSTIFSNQGRCVVWNGNMWIAAGTNNTTIARSYDGINWTSSTLSTDGSMWVIVGSSTNINNPRIIYSYDGITWSGATHPNNLFPNQGLSVAWNGTMWVAGGQLPTSSTDPQIAYSYDGITWSASTSGNAVWGQSVNGITWNGYKWVACGADQNSLGYSFDGINWSASTNGNIAVGAFAYQVASKPSPNLFPPR